MLITEEAVLVPETGAHGGVSMHSPQFCESRGTLKNKVDFKKCFQRVSPSVHSSNIYNN